MKIKWVITFVCLISLGTFFGFIYIAKAEDKQTIDIVLKNSSSDYWKYMKAGMTKGYANFGANGKIFIPAKDDKDQKKILQKVLKQKPSALIVSLTNPRAAEPLLNKYKNEHIPVLLVDTKSNWSGQTSFIGTENMTLGQKAGELLTSMLQPGDKVALISQQVNNTVNSDRIDGARMILTAAGIDIVAEKLTQEDQYDAASIMDRILQKYPDLKGVYAVNDELALSVLNYAKAKGVNLPVIGSDGSIEMINDVENGKLDGTIAQNPYDIGYLSIENALKAIKGQPGEKVNYSSIDIITKDNAKSKKDFLQQIIEE